MTPVKPLRRFCSTLWTLLRSRTWICNCGRLDGRLRTFCAQNADTLRSLHLCLVVLRLPGRPIASDGTNEAIELELPIPRLVGPLLGVHHSQELVLDFCSSYAPFNAPLSKMLWPLLEHPDIPNLAVSPDRLWAVACYPTCGYCTRWVSPVTRSTSWVKRRRT